MQQVTHSSNVQKFTIEPSVEEYVTHEHSEEDHVILDPSDVLQVTLDSSNVQKVTIDPSVEEHVTNEHSEEQHVILDPSDVQQVTIDPEDQNIVQLVDMVDPPKNTMEGLDFEEINDMEQIIEDLAEDRLEHLENNDQSCAELFQDQTMLIQSISQSIEFQSNSELLNQSNLTSIDQYSQPLIIQSNKLIKSTPPKQIKKAPVFRCNFDSCNLTFKVINHLIKKISNKFFFNF